MCGILGLIGGVEIDRFNEALELLHHRGPDDSGTYHSGPFHLGFKRLSIIDLKPEANQPMFSKDKRYSILFNGEIYNFKAIRQELEELGLTFETSGDTEVILQAYIQWGTNIFERLNGMFSIAIFDFQGGEVILARDRLGIKPLFYHNSTDSFAFSSEIKSLIHLSDSKLHLNLDSLFSYLCFRYSVSGESLFSGFFSFPAGCWMKIRDSKIIEKERYWNLSNYANTELETDHEKIVTEVRKLLEDSVKRRMVSDVPIGAYLSGGIDSSAVAAIMAQNTDSSLRTYTIGFSDEGFNEFSFSRIVSNLYRTNHTEITLDSDDYLSTLRELIRIKDAPLGVPNEVPLYLMSKKLKEDITVVLSGEGADEIFGGYGRIFRSSEDVKLIEEWKNRDFSLESELDLRLSQRYGKSFESEIEMFLHLYRYNSLDTLEYLFGENIVNDFNHGSTLRKFEEVFSEVEKLDFQTKMMYVFENLHLPGLLQRLDSTTMGASVEGRVPFVDHHLVEYSFRIPNCLKMRWKSDPPEGIIGADSSENYDVTKWVLKEACRDILPEEIINRKKVGFPVPLQNWFGSGSLNDIRSKLLNGIIVESGLISREKMGTFLMEENDSGTNPMLVWMLINLEIFFEEFPNLQINVDQS